MPNELSQIVVAKLERIAGHKFNDADLLARALTHSSYFAHESNKQPQNYERLEFLGDRVLGVCLAELLYLLFPQATEGELSKRFNALVNAETCASVAKDSGLVPLIRLGPELMKATKPHINIYADVMESFIAAIFLDAGLAITYKFVERYWRELALSDCNERADAKSALQEWAHKQNGAQPVYRLIERRGSDHDPIFLIELSVAGFPSVRAEGSSKRKAQGEAAKKMLQQEKVW